MGLPGTGDLWWVGVILSIFAAVFGSLGDNLIKLSYTKEHLAVKAGMPATPIACRGLWWAGMLCITVLNTSLVLIAYVFADASLTIPFAGLHICFNVGFARLLNGERFTSRQIGFTFIILVGVTVVLVSGNHDTVQYTVDGMQDLMETTGFICMSVGILFIICVQIPIVVLHPNPQVACLCSSTLVGTFASITQVFAKVMSESLHQAVTGDASKVFSHFIAYVSIFVTICSAILQLSLLNRALSMYNAFVVVPVVNSTLIILGSLYAAVLFQEYTRFDLKSSILMPVGIVTTGVGVALLSWDHNPAEPNELLLGSQQGIVMNPMLSHHESFATLHELHEDQFYEKRPQSMSMQNVRSAAFPRHFPRGHSYHSELYRGGGAGSPDVTALQPLQTQRTIGPYSSNRTSLDIDDIDEGVSPLISEN
eukprot:CAMPEP_0203787138 /NCGR_PEP_ID=MMETSP0100_2-20121128/2049_1 /ASSEMBLY_ACC=CAM_ASM_000210 /TAXON_ID=96639 /ORGANISM=" , Strain NY0313808BC1" /LENGTH=422 /DNA_ID=CAMNT_0050689585 /DNA_START=28 /DNA_END=1293 /DNA_ORIENTATION=-